MSEYVPRHESIMTPSEEVLAATAEILNAFPASTDAVEVSEYVLVDGKIKYRVLGDQPEPVSEATIYRGVSSRGFSEDEVTNTRHSSWATNEFRVAAWTNTYLYKAFRDDYSDIEVPRIEGEEELDRKAAVYPVLWEFQTTDTELGRALHLDGNKLVSEGNNGEKALRGWVSIGENGDNDYELTAMPDYSKHLDEYLALVGDFYAFPLDSSYENAEFEAKRQHLVGMMRSEGINMYQALVNDFLDHPAETADRALDYKEGPAYGEELTSVAEYLLAFKRRYIDPLAG